MKDFLPIGSVVLIRNSTKKLTIFGIMQVKEINGKRKVFDYMGVPYPEGYLGFENAFVFNHDDVTDVIFKGYENPEREKLMAILSDCYDQVVEDIVNQKDDIN